MSNTGKSEGTSQTKSAETKKKKVAASKGLVLVVPTKFDMYEPFQRVSIPMGVPTPIKKDGWVKSQIDAGLLEIVK